MADGDGYMESIKDKIRAQLNADKVKLWLPPFTGPDGQEKGEEPTELIISYSQQFSVGASTVTSVLEELRRHACAKLFAARSNASADVAQLRVKVVGNNNTRSLSSSLSQENTFRGNGLTTSPLNSPGNTSGAGSVGSTGGAGGMFNVEISLTRNNGRDLRALIANKCLIQSADHLKLIVSGRVIKDDLMLDQQHVKNGCQVMALSLSTAESSVVDNNNTSNQLARTRQATEWMVNRTDDDEDDGRYNLVISDQSGRALDLPREERKALTIAMMLHERGRSLLKRKDFASALIFLLDADLEFTKCRSSLLDAVDNYAVLNLDIVWCYLSLRNLSALPDADVRLKASEEGFRKSYGPNVERLEVVKGIVAFLQRRYIDANTLLNRAGDELRLLKVDEDSMNEVMSMGFSSSEARLGLRACSGDIQNAITHILNDREKRAEERRKEQEERKKSALRRSLGKTANGQLVDVDLYTSLISMGYSRGAARESLRQSNNDIINAVQIITEHPDLLSLPDPPQPPGRDATHLTQVLVDQLVTMGFDPVSAHAALNYFNANPQRAIEELMNSGGVAREEWLRLAAEAAGAAANGSTSTSHSLSNNSGEEGVVGGEVVHGEDEGGMSVEERERVIHEELRPDISSNAEDYLDLTLEDEETLLQEYQTRLMSINNT